MKAKLALVAREVIISADSGVPSAINIIEGLRPEGFPAFLNNIAFLSVWRREDGDPMELNGEVSVLIDEKEVIKHGVTMAFKGTLDIARQVSQFQGLVLEKPSTLTFRLTFEHVSAEYSISVVSNVQVDTQHEEIV